MSDKRPKWPYVLSVVVLGLLAVCGVATYQYLSTPDTGPAYGRTSGDSAKLNDAYLNYVRMNNPELAGVPNGNLLAVGYRICANLHSFSELTLVNMAEIEYTGAGQRIYDGATQYLCEAGS